jgi:hypothetical protein
MINNKIKRGWNWKQFFFKKLIKTKQIDIKKSGTKSKEKKLEGLKWKYRGGMNFY